MSDTTINDVGDQFLDMVKGHAEELGVELRDNLDDIRAYTAERLHHLALAVGQPGYERAVEAERDNILLRATVEGIESADAIDAKLLAFTTSLLTFGAKALDVVL